MTYSYIMHRSLATIIVGQYTRVHGLHMRKGARWTDGGGSCMYNDLVFT